MDLRIAHFAPFISHKLMGYSIELAGRGKQPPVLFVNKATCRLCGFVFSQLRLDQDEMTRIYEDYRGPVYSYVRNIYEPGYAEINSHIGSHSTEIGSRRTTVLNFLKDGIDLFDVKQMLDYGGDRGQHIPEEIKGKKFVYDISGVAPVKNVASIPYLDGYKFDFVMCCNVLEHVSYPKEILRDISEVCSSGATVFIDVPMELQEENEPYAFHEHINFFSELALIKALEACKFKVLKTEVVSLDLGWAPGPSRAIYAAAQKM